MFEKMGHDDPDSENPDFDRRDFDRLVDLALGTYAGADPSLEHRVLTRIAVERAAQPRLHWMLWAAALAGAACLLVLMVLIHGRHRQVARSAAANAFSALPMQPRPKAEARLESRPTQLRSGLPHHAQAEGAAGKLAPNRLPKLDIFPTPHPLSPAEQALVDFAAQAPKAAREDFVNDREQASGPIAIAAIRVASIRISPLEPPDTGSN